MDTADSAYRHGVADEDIDHAISNAVSTRVLRRGEPLVLITIGPDRGGRWLELIWYEFDDRDLLVHAMGLRLKVPPLSAEGIPMTTYRTKSGQMMTEADVDALTEEVVNADYDVDEVNARPYRHPRPGRPPMGSGPALQIQVRLDPELRQALDDAANRDGLSVSEVIRQALRSHLAA